jgi:Family of unknown function (DUF6527)
MVRKLLNFFSTLFVKKYKHELVEDMPDVLKTKTAYFVGNKGYYWQVVFVCPCGCKKNLHMNLNSDYEPYWKYVIEKNDSVTLSPSVHRIVGCKSHFFLKKGKINWA